MGRLKPDVSIERAREELRSLSEDLRRRRPDTHRDIVAAVAPLHDEIVRQVRSSLLVMLGAVGLVLVIACVNLANLLIVRAMGQGREIAIRLAIGATRTRITIDLAFRGLILGGLGGTAGLVCGVWTRSLLGFQAVSPGYFATLQIPLVRGRLLSAEDRAGAPAAAVINEAFVRRYLAGRDPIGQRFRRVQRATADLDAPELTIVGVVRDARRDRPHTDLTPQVYLSAAQPETYPWTRVEEVGVRAAAGDPRRLVRAIQRAVWSIDPTQPIMSVITLGDAIAGSTAARRFNTTLLSAVAILAFALAMVGVYGVVAHTAAQRTREIGIRIALGAGRRHVLSLVVASGVQWALLGIVIGLAGAYAGTRLLAALLFGVTPTDLATFAGLAAIMLGVAALASYVPARRAASVNPVSALRAD